MFAKVNSIYAQMSAHFQHSQCAEREKGYVPQYIMLWSFVSGWTHTVYGEILWTLIVGVVH